MLEIEQSLEAALRNFRLVRRVGRIPTRVFQYIAQDHRRQQGLVIPHADHVVHQAILATEFPQATESFCFISGPRQIQFTIQLDTGRECRGYQVIQAFGPNHPQHMRLLFRTGANVSSDEIIVTFQRAQR